jgi:intein-encoded DNA endonuclease-like protein
MPNKSDKLGKVEVPEDYFIDFVRGYFDGDGSYNSYWDKRWRSSFMFYTKFSSTSLGLIKWLRKSIENKVGIIGSLESYEYKREGWSDRYILKYAKTETKVLIENMYYDREVPCLSRKKAKIDRILAIDNN